jgi:hypothetical protein
MRRGRGRGGLASLDRVGRDRACVRGLRVPAWIGYQHAGASRERVAYLHILHRIRLLGRMTGVFDSGGDCGCPANMSPGGAEPSPSTMIGSASYVPGDDPTWTTNEEIVAHS